MYLAQIWFIGFIVASGILIKIFDRKSKEPTFKNFLTDVFIQAFLSWYIVGRCIGEIAKKLEVKHDDVSYWD